MPTIAQTDLDVFPLCLGGNVFGWTADEAQSFAVLDAYVAAGGNFIDTADVYSSWADGHSGGESEAVIGRWMAARGNRDQLIIATKVAKLASRPGLSAANIAAAAEDSLARLGTDRIDLYYAHQDDPDVPLEESLGAFDALVRDGKVRHVAASNFGPERLAEALAVAEREGLARYVALQPEYNLVARGVRGRAPGSVCRARAVVHPLLRTGDGLPVREVPAGRRPRRQPPGGRGGPLPRRARHRGSRRARRDRRGARDVRRSGRARLARGPADRGGARSRAPERRSSWPTCFRWRRCR